MPNHEQLPKCSRAPWKGPRVQQHVQTSALSTWGGGMYGCVFTKSTVIFESLSVFRCKCDQKRVFNCNSQSIMQIQIDVSDVKCLSSAITLEDIYLLLICFCHYKLRINTVPFLAYSGIKIREPVLFYLWGKKTWDMGNGSGRLLVFGKVPVTGLSGDYMTLLCSTRSIHTSSMNYCVFT